MWRISSSMPRLHVVRFGRMPQLPASLTHRSHGLLVSVISGSCSEVVKGFFMFADGMQVPSGSYVPNYWFDANDPTHRPREFCDAVVLRSTACFQHSDQLDNTAFVVGNTKDSGSSYSVHFYQFA